MFYQLLSKKIFIIFQPIMMILLLLNLINLYNKIFKTLLKKSIVKSNSKVANAKH